MYVGPSISCCKSPSVEDVGDIGTEVRHTGSGVWARASVSNMNRLVVHAFGGFHHGFRNGRVRMHCVA